MILDCEDFKILENDLIENYASKLFSKKHIEAIISELKNNQLRFYHNWENHIIPLFKLLKNNDLLSNEFIYTLLLHDIVYDSKKNDNEINSLFYFQKICKEDNTIKEKVNIELVESMILGTTHKPEYVNNKYGEQIKLFNRYDAYYIHYEWNTLLKIEHLIQKEFEWVDWSTYVAKRCEILENIFGCKAHNLINYLKNYQPRIGVFCGSFNPFHIGHLNVLEQAEKVFDKVILGVGVNDDKKYQNRVELPQSLSYHQVEKYNGLLTDFLDSFQYPVTLVRGLRNGKDLEDEANLRAWLKDIGDVCYFLTDKSYSHISSSTINSLKDKYPAIVEEYIVK